MECMGQVIRLNTDTIDEYKRIHAAVWPAVLKAISQANIRNYTIFLKEPENLLFAYWEYHGQDFVADVAGVKHVAAMQGWLQSTDPLQNPFDPRTTGR